MKHLKRIFLALEVGKKKRMRHWKRKKKALNKKKRCAENRTNKKKKGWNKTKRGWNSCVGWTKRQALKEKRRAELKKQNVLGFGLKTVLGWKIEGWTRKKTKKKKGNMKLRKKKRERWTKWEKYSSAVLKLKLKKGGAAETREKRWN